MKIRHPIQVGQFYSLGCPAHFQGNKSEIQGSHNGHQCSKLFLLSPVYLVRNGHEEGLWFLNIQLTGGGPEGGLGGTLSKHLGDWNPIS